MWLQPSASLHCNYSNIRRGAARKDKLFRTSSFSLIHANLEVFSFHTQTFPLLIFILNTVQAPIHAITVTVICSGEQLLAAFITATSDARPTKHK